MTKADRAVELGLSGCSCSESVLAAFGEKYGLSQQMALRLGSGLSGGMGNMAGTCGAVSAAYCILGLAHGGDAPGNPDARQYACAEVREFAMAFTAKRGTTTCATIIAQQGVDVPQEWESFMSKGLNRSLCPEVIRDAAHILENMLGETD